MGLILLVLLLALLLGAGGFYVVDSRASGALRMGARFRTRSW